MAHATDQRDSAADRIEVRIYSDQGSGRSEALLLALNVLAFIAGAAVPAIIGLTSASRADLNTILIAAGTLCLGLASASILFQQRRARERTALLAQCDSLRGRAETLLRDFNANRHRADLLNRER